MENDFIYFKNLIEDNGYKFTKQKKFILETLIKSNVHITIEELYQKIKKNSISIATVYRSIKVFKKLNIIKEINVDGINYYEMKIFSKKPIHIHFKCKRCNNITDIDELSLIVDYLNLNNKINAEKGLIVFDTDIMIEGICNNCKEYKDK